MSTFHKAGRIVAEESVERALSSDRTTAPVPRRIDNSEYTDHRFTRETTTGWIGGEFAKKNFRIRKTPDYARKAIIRKILQPL